MPEPHVFDTTTMEWAVDTNFPGIAVKVIESKDTHPTTSVVMVRLDVGGQIGLHTHEIATETAYVLAGEGTFTMNGVVSVLTSGMGLTVPPGIVHGVRSTGSAALELIAMHSPATR